jgi:hypothetical protein
MNDEQRHRLIWAALAFAIAVALTCLLLLLAEDASGQAKRQSAEAPPSKYDAKMLALDKIALDDAYRTQLELLFSVWLKDDPADVSRISRGLANARRAYAHAAEQIEKREQRGTTP